VYTCLITNSGNILLLLLVSLGLSIHFQFEQFLLQGFYISLFFKSCRYCNVARLKMADSPRRLKFVPATGDQHETVQGHISVPVTTRRARRRDPSPSDQTLDLDTHIAAPAVTQSDNGPL
jgi:hypothetical protein